MGRRRVYKKNDLQVSEKTGKILMCVFFVLRIILLAVCVWGLISIFT